jgi:hypothetical protein
VHNLGPSAPAIGPAKEDERAVAQSNKRIVAGGKLLFE